MVILPQEGAPIGGPKVATVLGPMVSARIAQRSDRLTMDLLGFPHRRLDHRAHRLPEVGTAIDRPVSV